MMEFLDNAGNWLLEPFKYEFFRNGILAAVLVGALCGLIGIYVVLRRMSYIGHGLSHSIFGGAIVSYALSLDFYLGAGLWGFLSAILIVWVSRRRNIGADAAIGIITTASFAVGVIIISSVRNLRRNPDAVLFGNILGVKSDDVLIIAGTALVICVAIFFVYKQLLFTTFDPEVAQVYGVRVRLMDIIFSLILAAMLVVSMQIVGVTLIAASLVTPPVIARLYSNNFHRMIFMSTAIGAFSGLVGVYASWHLKWATGATIVVTLALIFTLSFAFTSLRNGSRARRRLRQFADTQALRAGVVPPELVFAETHLHAHSHDRKAPSEHLF